MISVHAPPEHYQSPIVRFGTRFFAVVLVIVGVASTVPLARSIVNARASVTWPTAAGTVADSRVEAQMGGAKRSYKAQVRYEYTVNGRRYESFLLSFRDLGSSNRSKAEAVVAKYP